MAQRPDISAARVGYIDGLRGLAVAMVVVYHAWYHFLPAAINPVTAWRDGQIHIHYHNVAEFLASRGYQGVSLFLVLSGFCLAFPALRRHDAGERAWFIPSDFMARRALRILPPYFSALGLFCVAALVLKYMHVGGITDLVLPANFGRFLLQASLLNNITGYPWVNGSFWSLGLEWQWYWLFPLVLVLCARSPILALPLTLVVAMGWHSVMQDTFLVTELPQRLFEFTCGVAAAYAVVHAVPLRRRYLATGCVAALLLAEGLPFLPLGSLSTTVERAGLHQPLYGIAFASLVLLGSVAPRLNNVLSSQLSVGLGLISYSVYLIHEPVVQAIDVYAPAALRSSPLIMIPAALAGIMAGAAFYALVERPLTQSARVRALGAPLAARLRWIHRLWPRFEPRTAVVIHPQSGEAVAALVPEHV